VVEHVERLTPRMTRVTLGGGDLAAFTWPGPASHLKVLLPKPGESDITLPEPGPDGLARFDPANRPISRTYTPRRFDPATGHLDIDFVLHGEGPASTWAEQVTPGQRLAVSQPRRRYDIDPAIDWQLLAGDESALPAIATLLEARPTHVPVTVFVDVHDGKDEIDLATDASVTIHWLHRATERQAGELLEAAIRDWHQPAGDGHVWIACEAAAVRRVRRHLLQERDLSHDALITRGYWRAGAPDHPDHDYGDDPQAATSTST
jgi:NADPH-dependent ferric siderophore reductase